MQEVKEMFHTIRGIDYVRRVGGDVRKRREVRARQEEKIVERKRKGRKGETEEGGRREGRGGGKMNY